MTRLSCGVAHSIRAARSLNQSRESPALVAHEAGHELDRRVFDVDSRHGRYRSELNAYSTDSCVQQGNGISGDTWSNLGGSRLRAMMVAAAARLSTEIAFKGVK